MSATLDEILTARKKRLGDENAYKKLVPDYLYANLREGWGQRPYQQEAFGRLIYYLEHYEGRPDKAPVQLLFHMATGSGKTVIMAGLMLYFYARGYRHFLFFVNSTNIIQKTRANFLDPHSPKYLFGPSLSIDQKRIHIREVDHFTTAYHDDLNMVFSTIQGLHTRLNHPKENSITFEDLAHQKMVLISDEAHHLNADTRQGPTLNKGEWRAQASWEQTAKSILHAHPENVLLEFTATADLSHPSVQHKYHDKIIYDYPLKAFRKAGYAKEVQVLQAELADFERALQAVLLSQYRLKLFSQYRLLIKPVILFKSRNIKESERQYHDFCTKIKKLTPAGLEAVKRNPHIAPILREAFLYMEKNRITLAHLVAELKEDFCEYTCLTVNSQRESEEKQLAVNTLEAAHNPYRAVFAVDKLNEGWDVLNLFDIVRLYNPRAGQAGVPGKTTMSEAQLIGRGARYCPFRISSEQPLFQRKYDEQAHALKICETLYYHSAYNPRYIKNLHTALEDIGIRATDLQKCPLQLKARFRNSSFYQHAVVYVNEQLKPHSGNANALPRGFITTLHPYTLPNGRTSAGFHFAQNEYGQDEDVTQAYLLRDFGHHLLQKAFARHGFYHFANLKQYFPQLRSLDEFIEAPHYLGEVRVSIKGPPQRMASLSRRDQLDACIHVLSKLAARLQSQTGVCQGSRHFKARALKDVVRDKTLHVAKAQAQSQSSNGLLSFPLSDQDWYVFHAHFGTWQERHFLTYMHAAYARLCQFYDEVYVIFNKGFLTYYDFEDGRPVAPEFVLFLRLRAPANPHCHQVFVELGRPNGRPPASRQGPFLKGFQDQAHTAPLWEGPGSTVWRMAFQSPTEPQSVR